MDRLFNNHWFLKLVSLFIGVMLYMMVNMNSISSQPGVLPDNDESTYTIHDVEVNVYYNDEQYELVGYEETVDVKLTGTQTSIMLFQLSRPSYEVYVDLEDRGEGVHDVRIEHRDFPADLQVSLTPRFTSIELEELETRSYPVKGEATNKEEAEDGYTFAGPKVEPSEVSVTAGPSKHYQIDSLKAFADIAGADGQVETQSEVTAYDEHGNEIDVQIDPKNVTVTVPVTEPFKKVPIHLTREGNLPDDISIESLDMNPSEVTIYGPLDVINNINKVEVFLDVSQIEEDGEIELDLEYPEGIERIHPENVTVEVELGVREETAFTDVPIDITNTPENIEWEIQEPQEGVSNVTVAGPSSVLESLTIDDISLTAEWEEVEGESRTQVLQVTPSGPPEVQIKSEHEEIEVEWSQVTDHAEREKLEHTD